MKHKKFIVAIHDISPQWQKEIEQILALLSPLIKNNMSGAIISEYPRTSWSKHTSFVRTIKSSINNLIVHGWTHRSSHPYNIFSILSGGCNEFSVLNAKETRKHLQIATKIFADNFQIAATGFLPPCWQFGRHSIKIAFNLGYTYCVGWKSIYLASGKEIPIATWSWDWGKVNKVHIIANTFSAKRQTKYNAIPCIVLHPKDIGSGYIKNSIELIKIMLAKQLEPTTFQDYLILKHLKLLI